MKSVNNKKVDGAGWLEIAKLTKRPENIDVKLSIKAFLIVITIKLERS